MNSTMEEVREQPDELVPYSGGGLEYLCAVVCVLLTCLGGCCPLVTHLGT